MTEKPILFSTEMIWEILAGRKTQTRRLIKPRPPAETVCMPLTLSSNDAVHGTCTPLNVDYDSTVNPSVHSCGKPIRCPYWADRLWVREAHAIVPATAYAGSTDDGCNQLPRRLSPDGTSWAVYRQGWTRCKPGKWRPSIHMPRWACRLILNVKSICAERLQDITVEDIIAEGFQTKLREHDAVCDLRDQFAAAWDKLNGKRPGGSWADNPWVWAITFEVSDAS